MSHLGFPRPQGLYDPRNEHDGCGVGAVADIHGRKSHRIIEQGLEILVNLTHRGAAGADPETGDGAGILLQLPDAFLRKVAAAERIELPAAGRYAVGMVFTPQRHTACDQCRSVVEEVVAEEGQRFLGWRQVVTDNSQIGFSAKEVEPHVRQCFIAAAAGLDQDAFERKLYVIRRRAEQRVRELKLEGGKAFYICSLSSRTIVYKGLLLAHQLPLFYRDLNDPEMVSALALVHQRYSTNTFPTWDLAHPFRFVAHNGEINTLRGNINWMRARESLLASPLFGDDIKKLFPLITEGASDSACFDQALEFLVMGGRSLPHAMMMLIPDAWANNPQMDPRRRDFYAYHATMMEPWDGPAAVVFTDGRMIGATLDRNGLRPARYLVTKDGLVVLASEAGVLDIPPEEIERKWRLQPGKILVIDTERGRIIDDEEVKHDIVTQQPYGEWVHANRLELAELPKRERTYCPDHATLRTRQRAFGYTREEVRQILLPMAVGGQEPIGSMGADNPLAVLSERPVGLFHYFKQLFAQVTNPPIDPIREELVMSLATAIGPKQNLLGESPEHARRIHIGQPILTNDDLERIRQVDHPHFATRTLRTVFAREEGAAGMKSALDQLCQEASAAIDDGINFLVLSDRETNAELVPIPALLALAAVHHHLVRNGTRTRTGLIVESGEPREVHHFACLIGYGAGAVNPYLAFETIRDLATEGMLPEEIDAELAEQKYVKAVNKGLLKIISKMGISTIQSYCGAQIFEALGIGPEVIDRYFTGTTSRIGGIGLAEIAEDARRRHATGYVEIQRDLDDLDLGGEYQFREGSEHHGWNPETITLLQKAVREGDYASYQAFARRVNDQTRELKTLRGLFELKHDHPIPIDRVEPASAIVKRFCTGAMSYGSISQEAHTALAIAMNRLGGRSNTGEGGEDPVRFRPLPNGDLARSAIKQVASGRFGVTTEYLVNADELQIKMAQGAKPGEGGQLPGHKVSEAIAKVRHSTPGVTLISPPPHHDIYSIEDLAQLIYDLKNVNPRATVSVKLVAETGVGTVAAGVSKAHADLILVSGYDGGTGASPLSSIKHAGLPWEIGLADTQQTLVLNDLRGRTILQTDGQLRTGRDVVIAALLGAEEFGFATAALIAEGCLMMRKCHLNTCPVGIATQNPELRARFRGKPDHVVNYFYFVAQEARELMAQMGFATMDEMIGRVEMIEAKKGVDHWKAKGLDLSRLLYKPDVPARIATRHVQPQEHGLDKALDQKLLELTRYALDEKKKVAIQLPIRNIHRTVGALLAGEIARRYGAESLPKGTIECKFVGSAGQSFGAFCVPGLTLTLEGEANDYLGKGMSGGKIVVYAPRTAAFDPAENIVVGNTLLYGATGGRVFISGRAGERFAVRNSGCRAVVEGVGDHGCEYMTGGVVVVLGTTGRNFAAGMSGGIAFVLDVEATFAQRCNLGMVDLEPVADPEDRTLLEEMVKAHYNHTASERARTLLARWPEVLPKFVKVMPHEYRRVLEERRRAAAAGPNPVAAS
ncbi:MAG: glutamate synthase large subunit [Nitrospirae bacterium CG18_big_fil_WC_8_21_14_2_50_70_55]|nr:glutamate synthase large subunit [Deltaproteobacteria bacterium]PIQ06734.1 MAG: glutamate synthase large subunit [Nitrospirae bacterium CG18_big_fil_WC_8_21_14_2_50_70_55]PIU79200.1 MAG: glutamate synthase large subunit [Nitrospirae bacterium CG06_land_8_20_14_3_00_70_43]PIW83541.1 MAG: glutamate synthase large subunit [Nitrospirae bacterium CG_4_8_14_3_um_filter_70_85]PJB96720.1 MAG: glutamate synthase large subunit [Nitrospirae bacterium CG_4_9_14_0_8_um_filter_70_14]